MTQSNVLTAAFRNMSLSQVTDIQNFDREKAFWRSVKVFLTVYTGYEKICPKLFDRKLNEWMDSMKEIYTISNPNMNYLLETKKDVVKQQMSIIIGIKKVRGLDLCTNLRVIFSIGQMSTGERPLDMTTEKQDTSVTLQCNFRQFRRFRVRRRIIKITAIADSWVHTNEPLNEFSINFSEISAEGFEDWFYVGRGVHLLIKIIMPVAIEPGADPVWLPKFYVHTIYLMLSNRCDVYDKQSKSGTFNKKHRTPANKSKITYIRKRVNPKSETAFWSDFKSSKDIMQQIRSEIVEKKTQNYSQISDILSRRVKFVDLQISSYFSDDYEDVDPVCLCSEWCNWNAFGHYNPVFRQLMVCQNKLYLSDRTNITDMYLYCCSVAIFTAEHTKSLPPVLRLLNDANNIRQLNYRIYYMTTQIYRDIYKNCVPSFELLLGLSYRVLRDQKIIPDIILDSSDDPFSDICFENITIFYKVLSDLHQFIATLPLFVPSDQNRLWFKELDEISREDYCNYISKAYEKRMTVYKLIPSYDFIFTEDLEYSSVLVRSDSQKQVKQIRDRVHKFALPVNPLNIRVTLESIVATFAGVYRILHKVTPMLSKVHHSVSKEHVFRCFQKMNVDFGAYITNTPFLFVTDLEDSSKFLWDSQNNHKYYMFYTLKLYFMSFGIQKNCLKSLLEWNDFKQVGQEFDFIFQLDLIVENKFQTLYMDPIFDLPQNISIVINDFYNTFWGMAAHEMNPNPPIDDCINSALYEYYRLYFWWNNGGNTRPKFTRILDVFYQMFEYIGSRSEELYYHIFDYIESIQSFEYYSEVLDTLVYYLVKADCAMIVCAIGRFFKQLHPLQNQYLCDNFISYSLIKPGWVPITRTMFEVFYCLDALKASYIVFDDQNNRISNALTQTRSLVKNIYRSFFIKLSYEWVIELSILYQNHYANPTVQTFFPLHVATGLSYVTHFIHDFRQIARYRLKVFLNIFQIVNFIQQQDFHYCIPIVQLFLQDYAAIDRAEPFFAYSWQNYYPHIFQPMNATAPNQLRIDLNEADNFII